MTHLGGADCSVLNELGHKRSDKCLTLIRRSTQVLHLVPVAHHGHLHAPVHRLKGGDCNIECNLYFSIYITRFPGSYCTGSRHVVHEDRLGGTLTFGLLSEAEAAEENAAGRHDAAGHGPGDDLCHTAHTNHCWPSRNCTPACQHFDKFFVEGVRRVLQYKLQQSGLRESRGRNGNDWTTAVAR